MKADDARVVARAIGAVGGKLAERVILQLALRPRASESQLGEIARGLRVEAMNGSLLAVIDDETALTDACESAVRRVLNRVLGPVPQG